MKDEASGATGTGMLVSRQTEMLPGTCLIAIFGPVAGAEFQLAADVKNGQFSLPRRGVLPGIVAQLHDQFA